MNEETKVVEEVAEETVAEPTMAMVMHDENAPIITMRKLLEAGVHFGHHTRKWNPKMGKFIYGARNGIYLIYLAKSAQKIEEAYLALKKIVDENGKVLFVGIKPQVKEVIEEQALRSGSFYITNRWLGGTLTNFKTIQRRIARLRELEDKEADGSFDRLPKKEVALLRKEKTNIEKMCLLTREMLEASVTMEKMDTDYWLDEVEKMEKEGIDFVNVSKIDIHMKKKLGAVIGATVMIVMMGLVLGALIYGYTQDTQFPLWALLIFAVPMIAVITGVIVAMRSRMKEIDKGEEDEAAKY